MNFDNLKAGDEQMLVDIVVDIDLSILGALEAPVRAKPRPSLERLSAPA